MKGKRSRKWIVIGIALLALVIAAVVLTVKFVSRGETEQETLIDTGTMSDATVTDSSGTDTDAEEVYLDPFSEDETWKSTVQGNVKERKSQMENWRKPESMMYINPQRVILQDGAEPEKLLEDCEQLIHLCNWGEINLTLVDLWMVKDRLLAELPNLPEWIAAEDRNGENVKRSLFKDYYTVCQSIACLLGSRIMGEN